MVAVGEDERCGFGMLMENVDASLVMAWSLKRDDGHVALGGWFVCECKDCATWHHLIGSNFVSGRRCES